MTRALLFLTFLLTSCGEAGVPPEPAVETSTSTTVNAAAQLEEYRDEVTELVEDALSADAEDYSAEVTTFRALVRSLESIEPPQGQSTTHSRLVVMAEETAEIYDRTARACKLMTSNNLRRAAQIAPEPGDDDCYGHGFDALEAEAALQEEVGSL